MMADDAVIAIYSCEVAAPGSDGHQLVSGIADLTGARVVASNNLTGAGGDWLLEESSDHGNTSHRRGQPLDVEILSRYRHSLPANTPPAITLPGPGLLYTEREGYLPIDILATVIDAEDDWTPGSLVVQITANAEPTDRVAIRQATVGGALYTVQNVGSWSVKRNGTVVADMDAPYVTGGDPLTLTFKNATTTAFVQEMAQIICFMSTSSDPSTLQRTVTFTVNDPSLVPDSATQTIDVAATGGANWIQDGGTDGLVVFEAEDYDFNALGVFSWEEVTAPAGYSGAGAMQALPDIGKEYFDPHVDSGWLHFDIEFVKTGPHYVWVLGLDPTLFGAVHIGLDHVVTTDSDTLYTTDQPTYLWTNNARPGMNLTIPKAITLTNSGPLGSVAAVIADTSAFPEYLRVVPGTIALPSGASGQMVVVLDASLAPRGVAEQFTETLTIRADGSKSTVEIEIDVDLDPYGGGGGCVATGPATAAGPPLVVLILVIAIQRLSRRKGLAPSQHLSGLPRARV